MRAPQASVRFLLPRYHALSLCENSSAVKIIVILSAVRRDEGSPNPLFLYPLEASNVG